MRNMNITILKLNHNNQFYLEKCMHQKIKKVPLPRIHTFFYNTLFLFTLKRLKMYWEASAFPEVSVFTCLHKNKTWKYLGCHCAYMHIAPTHKMEVAFLSLFVAVVVIRHWNSVLLVSRSQQRQLHIRLTERELNGIAVINFPSMIAENFREFIDELHYNYIHNNRLWFKNTIYNCCRCVKSCF